MKIKTMSKMFTILLILCYLILGAQIYLMLPILMVIYAPLIIFLSAQKIKLNFTKH